MKLLSAWLLQILLFSLVLYSVSSPIAYSQFTKAALKDPLTDTQGNLVVARSSTVSGEKQT